MRKGQNSSYSFYIPWVKKNSKFKINFLFNQMRSLHIVCFKSILTQQCQSFSALFKICCACAHLEILAHFLRLFEDVKAIWFFKSDCYLDHLECKTKFEIMKFPTRNLSKVANIAYLLMIWRAQKIEHEFSLALRAPFNKALLSSLKKG